MIENSHKFATKKPFFLLQKCCIKTENANFMLNIKSLEANDDDDLIQLWEIASAINFK